ncbi:MAG: tetratricopeptide repeat protein [Fibrobacter sp.]|nr:tetratricopeptide repeat protein [Fibrobacter sp.]
MTSKIQVAIDTYRSNRIPESIVLFEEILNINHDNVEILLPYINALRRVADYKKAKEVLAAFLEKDNSIARIHFEMGLTKKLDNEAPETIIPHIEKAISLGMTDANVWYLLGDLQRLCGWIDDAIISYKKSLQKQSGYFGAAFSLGMVYKQLGQFGQAKELLLQALSAKPDSAETLNNLGLVLESLGKIDAASAYFEDALDLTSGDTSIIDNYCGMLIRSGKIDAAIDLLKRMVEQRSDDACLWNSLGNLYVKKQEIAIAKECYIRALKIKNDYAEAHYNLGLIMRDWYMLDEAVTCFSNAYKLDSKLVDALLNLGEAYRAMGEIEKAEVTFDKILLQNPEHDAAYDNLLLAINYDEKYSAEQVYRAHKEWGLQKKEEARLFCNSKNPGRKIKIGYVSPDFCKHPAAKFMKPLFMHKSDIFENYCYAQIVERDQQTEYFTEKADVWIETNDLTDTQLTDKIKADEIDILIDCAGHMGGNRLNVFAKRAAPIQISAFGYPCTTGLSSIDYRFSDTVTDDSKSELLYTENLLKLKSPFCVFTAPENSPDIEPLPALTNGYITFGSTHTTARLNKKVIFLWADILKKVKNAQLILFRTTLCQSIIERISEWFDDAGVQLARIQFLNRVPDSGHLTVYNSIDCLLDTFPWSGHTTACEALWMGVPVITLYGDRHAGRMVSSVLHFAGYKELITYSEAEYVDKAVHITRDIAALDKLRKTLRDKMKNSRLMDTTGYVREVESVYRTLWESYCLK